MDTRNRVYYAINEVVPSTYELVKKVSKIPGVKCTFRSNVPHLLIGCNINREEELLTILKANDIDVNYQNKEETIVIPKNDLTEFLKSSLRKTKYKKYSFYKVEFETNFIIYLEVNGRKCYLNNDVYALTLTTFTDDATHFNCYKSMDKVKKEYFDKAYELAEMIAPLLKQKKVSSNEFNKTINELKKALGIDTFKTKLFLAIVENLVNGTNYSYGYMQIKDIKRER